MIIVILFCKRPNAKLQFTGIENDRVPGATSISQKETKTQTKVPIFMFLQLSTCRDNVFVIIHRGLTIFLWWQAHYDITCSHLS